MVKVGRRFFFNQTFQKKQRRVSILTIIGVIVAIIVTFSVTSYFHDNSAEKGKVKYKVKQEYNVEVFSVMPSFLNFFEELENVPLNSIAIEYDKDFTYDENGDNCTDEELELIRKIRLGEAKADDKTDPFACLNFVPNKVGSFPVKITVNKEENVMTLNIFDNKPPTFVAQDVTITNEESYTADNFIVSCDDNSKDDCYADFYIPLRGERTDYSKYKEPGVYEIKIVAKDKSGNVSEPQTVTLTIKKVNYYTITYNSNGGNKIEPQTVREGEKVYSPYPSRDGYTFEGWYSGKSKFNFDSPIDRDITLTAKWKKQSSGGGGSSGGGSSYSGGGGGTSDKCKYGKFNDYSKSVSMYANVLYGKKVGDCAEKNNSKDYAELRSIAVEIAYDLTERDVGAIDKDAQSMAGTRAKINHSVKTTQIVNSKGGLAGVLVEIKSTAPGFNYTYTLYDCTMSTCKWK